MAFEMLTFIQLCVIWPVMIVYIPWPLEYGGNVCFLTLTLGTLPSQAKKKKKKKKKKKRKERRSNLLCCAPSALVSVAKELLCVFCGPCMHCLRAHQQLLFHLLRLCAAAFLIWFARAHACAASFLACIPAMRAVNQEEINRFAMLYRESIL